MEAKLASIADLLLIIVESPGTFAELGAFSISDSLRPKILPLVDKKYEGKESFIATGPIRWIDRDSSFAPTIYVHLEKILEAAIDLEDRISRIPKSKTVRVDDLGADPKYLLFFICDLIAVIYPATLEILDHYLRRIVPSISTSDTDLLPTLIGLAVAMNLLRSAEITSDDSRHTYYWPAEDSDLSRPFHRREFLNLPTQRVDHVSVLLAIPNAAQVLNTIQRDRK